MNPVYRIALSVGMAALLILGEIGVVAEGWGSLQPLAKVDLPPTNSAKHPIDSTILHLLGIDHERLTFYHSGIQRHLTNGHIISNLLA